MRNFIFITLVVLGVVAQAQSGDPKQAYVEGYAAAVLKNYEAATAEAIKLNDIIQAFTQNPTPELFEAAKVQWIAARKVYGITEVYRFYDGPIEGPEGQINAWPLDEVYIDYVKGQSDAGIINNIALYPTIDEALLKKINGADGEANVATGWHAIEFLLWGQDLPEKKDKSKAKGEGPGERDFSDYVASNKGAGVNAERRKTYLSVVSNLLVSDLQEVTEQWKSATPNAYVNTFVQDPASFGKIITSAKFLADEELAVERMLVAYDLRDQEHEHSCFSDTTHFDIYYNFVGIKNVLTDNYNGQSFVSLVASKNGAQADALVATLASLEVKFLAFPAPFDTALNTPDGRAAIKSIVDELNVLGKQIAEGLVALQ